MSCWVVYMRNQQLFNINQMILLLVFALLFDPSYCKCRDNCYSCNSFGCTACQTGYTLYSRSCYLNSSSGSIDSNDSTTGLSAGLIATIVCCSLVGLCLFCVVCSKCRKRHINSQQLNNQVGPTNVNINLAQNLDLQRSNNKLRSLRVYFDRFSLQNTTKWTNKQSDEQQFPHQQICTICLNKLLNAKTHCGHSFHVECLQLWFNKSPTCPTCRTEIEQIVLYCKICYGKCKILKLREIKDIKKQTKVCDLCMIGSSQ